MNVGLLDPFTQLYPELIEDCLQYDPIRTVAFNPFGTLLATGGFDGKVAIWDFDTRVVVRTLKGHSSPILCMAWNDSGRCLATGSQDGLVDFWEFDGSTFASTQVKLEESIAQIEFEKQSGMFLCTTRSKAYFLTSKGEKKLIYEAPENGGLVVAVISTKDEVVIGLTDGTLKILNVKTNSIKDEIKISNQIKGISCSIDGKSIVVNVSDRTLRVFSYPLVVKYKFQDLIDRMNWIQAKFSNNGDYVIAGSGGKSKHNLYVLNAQEGNLIKMLEGPKEGFVDFSYHPSRSIIVSLSYFGTAYIWNTQTNEQWSGFAPDFTVVDNNIEYVEAEDEFDYKIPEAINQQVESMEFIDVLTRDTLYSNLHPNPLVYLPLEDLSDDEV